MFTNGRARTAGVLLLLLTFAGCDRILPHRSRALPTAAEADSVFAAHGIQGEVSLAGNVVELRVAQAPDQLRRGGALWARVGPYIYLFSPATTDLFEAYPGLAGVRTRTHVEDQEVARALLLRDTMRAGEWVQANNVLAHALREGTTRPSTLEELVRWGERYASFVYNPQFVPADSSR